MVCLLYIETDAMSTNPKQNLITAAFMGGLCCVVVFSIIGIFCGYIIKRMVGKKPQQIENVPNNPANSEENPVYEDIQVENFQSNVNKAYGHLDM